MERAAGGAPHTKGGGFWNRAFHLYWDGFRSMTLGKTLWAVILVKLFIIFAVLKVFFFPNFLSSHAEEGAEDDFVATELIDRACPTPERPPSTINRQPFNQ